MGLDTNTIHRLVKLTDKRPFAGKYKFHDPSNQWIFCEEALPILEERARYWFLTLFTCSMHGYELSRNSNGSKSHHRYEINESDLKARMLSAGWPRGAIESEVKLRIAHIPVRGRNF